MIFLEHKTVLEIYEINDRVPKWEPVRTTYYVNDDPLTYEEFRELFDKLKDLGTHFSAIQQDDPDEDMVGHQKIMQEGIFCPGYYLDKNNKVQPE